MVILMEFPHTSAHVTCIVWVGNVMISVITNDCPVSLRELRHDYQALMTSPDLVLVKVGQVDLNFDGVTSPEINLLKKWGIPWGYNPLILTFY